jgi:ssDNA-binding Zn-finger/Zn-ribbon topoisomerase 1
MVTCYCRTNGCSFVGQVQLRKFTRKLILCENGCTINKKISAKDEKGASITGVPCPNCGNHTLRRGSRP